MTFSLAKYGIFLQSAIYTLLAIFFRLRQRLMIRIAAAFRRNNSSLRSLLKHQADENLNSPIEDPKIDLPPLSVIQLECSPKHQGKVIASIGFENALQEALEEESKALDPEKKVKKSRPKIRPAFRRSQMIVQMNGKLQKIIRMRRNSKVNRVPDTTH